MIKVLHFVSVPARWSGVMNVIMNYYRHIDRSKVQFDFLCFLSCEDSYAEEIKELGGQVFFLAKPGLFNGSLSQLKSFFAAHAKDYLWFHNHEVYLSFLLKPLCTRYGIRNFIVHCHATRYSDHALAAVRNRLLCLPIRFLDCYHFACSKAAGQFLYRKKGFTVMTNAVDGKAFSFDEAKRTRLRREFHLSDQTRVIGHVGRFEKQKNHAFLLEQFAACLSSDSNLYLVCIGDGNLLKAMKEKANALQISDHVLFLGRRSDVSDLLNMMDLFLLPSFFEGFPVSLVEARMNGLSCIVSDRISDEISDDRIYQLPLDHKKNVWKKMIFEHVSDGRHAFSHRKYFDISACAKHLEDFYLTKRTADVL